MVIEALAGTEGAALRDMVAIGTRLVAKELSPVLSNSCGYLEAGDVARRPQSPSGVSSQDGLHSISTVGYYPLAGRETPLSC